MKKSKHHRRPRFHNGRNDKRNISYVPEFKHRAYHCLFGVMNVYEVAEELNNTWVDPDYKLIVKRS